MKLISSQYFDRRNQNYYNTEQDYLPGYDAMQSGRSTPMFLFAGCMIALFFNPEDRHCIFL
jgi:hypothetical protein